MVVLFSYLIINIVSSSNCNAVLQVTLAVMLVEMLPWYFWNRPIPHESVKTITSCVYSILFNFLPFRFHTVLEVMERQLHLLWR